MVDESMVVEKTDIDGMGIKRIEKPSDLVGMTKDTPVEVVVSEGASNLGFYHNETSDGFRVISLVGINGFIQPTGVVYVWKDGVYSCDGGIVRLRCEEAERERYATLLNELRMEVSGQDGR